MANTDTPDSLPEQDDAFSTVRTDGSQDPNTTAATSGFESFNLPDPSLAAPKPEAPPVTWDALKNSDAFKQATPEQQHTALATYGHDTRNFLLSQDGVDAAQVDQQVQDFTQREATDLLPKPADDSWDFGKIFSDDNPVYSALKSAGATIDQSILGGGKGAIRYITPDLPSEAEWNKNGHQVGYGLAKTIHGHLQDFGNFLNTWKEEVPKGAGTDKDTVGDKVGQFAGGLIPYFVAMPAAVVAHVGESYGDTLDTTGSKGKAAGAAALAGFGDLAFMELGKYTSGVGKNIQSAAGRWATSIAAGTAGNISAQQLLKAGSAALNAPADERYAKFKEALTGLDLKEAGVQAAFALLATTHAEGARKTEQAHADITQAHQKFSEAQANAADLEKQGLPNAAAATREAAVADLHTATAAIHAKAGTAKEQFAFENELPTEQVSDKGTEAPASADVFSKVERAPKEAATAAEPITPEETAALVSGDGLHQPNGFIKPEQVKAPEGSEPAKPQIEGEHVVSTAYQDNGHYKVGPKFDTPHEGIGAFHENFDGVPEKSRGFIVQDAEGKQRFVNRQEVAPIAERAGQVPKGATEVQSQELKPVGTYGEGAAKAADRATTPLTDDTKIRADKAHGEQIAKELGLEFKGVQEVPKGEPLMQFTDPQSKADPKSPGTSVPIEAGKTVAELRAQVTSTREEFQKANRKGEVSNPVETNDQHNQRTLAGDKQNSRDFYGPEISGVPHDVAFDLARSKRTYKGEGAKASYSEPNLSSALAKHADELSPEHQQALLSSAEKDSADATREYAEIRKKAAVDRAKNNESNFSKGSKAISRSAITDRVNTAKTKADLLARQLATLREKISKPKTEGGDTNGTSKTREVSSPRPEAGPKADEEKGQVTESGGGTSKPAASKAPKIGDEAKINNIDSNLADRQEANGVSYEFFSARKGTDPRSTIRVMDTDSGNVVSITTYPTHDAAAKAYGEALKTEGLEPGSLARAKNGAAPTSSDRTEITDHQREKLGISKSDQNAFNAFQDIAQMFREHRAKPLAQRQAEFAQRVEKDIATRADARSPQSHPISSVFTDDQYVDFKPSKKGGVDVVAGETLWRPQGDPQLTPPYKKGKTITHFANAAELADWVVRKSIPAGAKVEHNGREFEKMGDGAKGGWVGKGSSSPGDQAFRLTDPKPIETIERSYLADMDARQQAEAKSDSLARAKNGAAPKTEKPVDVKKKDTKPVVTNETAKSETQAAAPKLTDVADTTARDLDKAVKLPKGATAVRVTTESGRSTILKASDLKGANPLEGAGPFKKIEAGSVGKDKKFIPSDEEIGLKQALDDEANLDDAESSFAPEESDLAARAEALRTKTKSPTVKDNVEGAGSPDAGSFDEVNTTDSAGSHGASSSASIGPTQFADSSPKRQQSTVEGVRAILAERGENLAPETADAIGRQYALLNRAFEGRLSRSDTAAREELFNRVQDDLVANARATGDPLKTESGAKYNAQTVAKSIMDSASKAGKSAAELGGRSPGSAGREFRAVEDALSRRPVRLDAPLGEDSAATVGDLTEPGDLADQKTGKGKTPVGAEGSAVETIRKTVARHFSAFSQWVGVPLERAPKATRAEVLEAAHAVYAKETGVSFGGGKRMSLNSEKLAANPEFQQAVRDRVVDRIKQDVRATIPRDREPAKQTAENVKAADKALLKHASDLLDRGTPLGLVLHALPEHIQARVKSVREQYDLNNGINAAVQRIIEAKPANGEERGQQAVAKLLQGKGRNLKVDVDPTLRSRRGAEGEFYPSEGRIALSDVAANETARRTTIIHEKIHDVLDDAAVAYEKGDHHLLSPRQLTAFRGLEDVMNQALAHESTPEDIRTAAQSASLAEKGLLLNKARREGGSRDLAGLTSLREFSNYLLTDSKFQERLNAIKHEGGPGEAPKTLLEKAKQWLKQIIAAGKPIGDGSLLDKGLDHALDLLREDAPKYSGDDTKPATTEQTKTPEFKKFFDGSKVVNAEGKPAVLFHGSRSDGQITEFNTKYGAYFTTDKGYAEGFQQVGKDHGATDPKMYEVFASVKNPKIYNGDNPAEFEAFTDHRTASADLIAQGFDGEIMHYDNGKHMDVRVTDPSQVKSSSDNSGAFDPNESNILKRTADDSTPDEQRDQLMRGDGGAGYVAAKGEALGHGFIGKSDKFWGIEDDKDTGGATFKKSGHSALECTGYALAIRDKLGSDRVKVFGFSGKDNPASEIGQLAGGHDFAVVDKQFIVDPWITDVEGISKKGVFDLNTDRAEIEKLYGPRSAWDKFPDGIASGAFDPSNPDILKQAANDPDTESRRLDILKEKGDDYDREVVAKWESLPEEVKQAVRELESYRQGFEKKHGGLEYGRGSGSFSGSDQAKSAITRRENKVEKMVDAYQPGFLSSADGIASGQGRFGRFDESNSFRLRGDQKAAPVEQTKTPEFKKFFGKSKVVDAQGNPQVVVHGTQKDFESFDTNGKNFMLARNLGAHFAVAPEMTNAFTIGTYAESRDYALASDPADSWHRTKSGELVYGSGIETLKKRPESTPGNMFPQPETVGPLNREEHGRQPHYGMGDDYSAGMLTPGGRSIPAFLKIEHPLEVDTSKTGDDVAVSRAVAKVVFPMDRDLFVKGVSASIGFDEKAAGQMWDDFKAGKPAGGYANLNELIDNYAGHINQDEVARAKELLKQAGYDGVHYENTSDNENVPGKSKEVYIAFDPEQIKSAIGNSGAFDSSNPDILKQAADDKNEQETQINFTEDFAKEHGYDDAGEMAVEDPHLYNGAAEGFRGETKPDDPALKVAASDPLVQDDTMKRAKGIADLMDKKANLDRPFAEVMQGAIEGGATTAEDFTQAYEKAGVEPELAKAVGAWTKTHFNLAAIDKAAEIKTEAAQGAAQRAQEEAKPVPADIDGEPTASSIKNATVDKERAARGLPSAIRAARKEFGDTWQRAMEKIDTDATWTRDLVAGLKKKARPLTDEENAGLLHRQIELQNDYASAADALNTAREANDVGAIAENRTTLARLSDDLLDVYNVGKKAGTENARGLVTRRMMANEDYSLASMETRTRAAKGGAELSPEQADQVRKLHEEIFQLQKEAAVRAASKDETASVAAGEAEVAATAKEIAKKAAKDKAKGKAPRDLDAERQSIVAGARKNLAKKGGDVSSLQKYAQKLAENYIARGITKLQTVSRAVHETLKVLAPELTEREVRDMISGYGDYKKLNMDAVKVKLRDLKGKLQQAAKLDDMLAKFKAPSKTGMEQRSPSDHERRLTKLVNEAKKNGDYSPTDPATQLKGALDSIKTRLKNQIKDLAFRIETGEKRAKSKGVEYDNEAETLKALRDRVQATLTEIEGKPEMSDEQRAEIAKRSLEKQITEYDRRLSSDDFSEKERRAPVSTPEVEALRARRDAIKAEYKELEAIAHPERIEERTVAAWRTRSANRIAELQEKLANGDFQKRPMKDPFQPTDPADRKIAADLERAKREFNLGLRKDQLENRSRPEKIADAFAKYGRAVKLTAFTTLGKLSLAAAHRMASTPVENLVGEGLSHLPGIREIAAVAPSEAGFSLKAEVRAVTEGVTQGFHDAFDIVRKGESDLDALYGKQLKMPREWYDWAGGVWHGFLKAPVKRAAFERSLMTRLEKAAANGEDIHDPLVRLGHEQLAYKDANRAIFMQDNRVVQGYKALIARLEAPNKDTGEVSGVGKAGATAARVLVPIVKIPTNYVGEAFTHAFGLASGSIKLAKALRGGVENLRPEEADLIMRHLKKGSIGAAVLLAGFFNPAPNAIQAGGYYQDGEKRKPGDIEAGRIRVFGHDVPTWATHTPLLEVFQLGATMRRVADHYVQKGGSKLAGLSKGALAGSLGLAEEVPFLSAMADMHKLGKDPGAYFGDIAKGIAIPAGLNNIATWTDLKADGSAQKRKPRDITERFETSIPGLRQRVPKKN